MSILASLGITKVRLTGGEPFVRNDLMKLINRIVETPGIEELHLTTNGVLTGPYIPELKKLGLKSVNLSLDTLDPQRFKMITRRDEFEAVSSTLDSLLEHKIAVKINAVVMEGKNIEDILPLVELTRKHSLDVRFIEEMPFNGEGNHYPTLKWTYKAILKYIREQFPSLVKVSDAPFSTSYNYQVPGHKGTVGVIAAFSRTFCGTCNRIRVTAQGTLKTCLYDDGVLDIRQLLRNGSSDDEIKRHLVHAFNHRVKDGYEAEKARKNRQPASESMSTIGG